MSTESPSHRLEFEAVDEHALALYMQTDDLLPCLREAVGPVAGLTSHRWLVESAAKRFIYSSLYGDLIKPGGRRVLDIAGGLSSLTHRLAECNRYHLVESLAHDQQTADEFIKTIRHDFQFSCGDWCEMKDDAEYDVIIANDFLPNVDQRLEQFLRRYMSKAHEVRVSLTYYDQPRSYVTRRIDGDEILTMLAWDGDQTFRTLRKVLGLEMEAFRSLFSASRASLFANGRQVVLGRIRRVEDAKQIPNASGAGQFEARGR